MYPIFSMDLKIKTGGRDYIFLCLVPSTKAGSLTSPSLFLFFFNFFFKLPFPLKATLQLFLEVFKLVLAYIHPHVISATSGLGYASSCASPPASASPEAH